MDVLKYKIGRGNKTKITFRLNKNSPTSSSVSLKVKKKGLCITLKICASTHHEINLVGIKARQVLVHKNGTLHRASFSMVKAFVK